MKREVKGSRQGDNGHRYERSNGDWVKIVIALLVGGGGGGSAMSYINSDNAVLKEKIITHIESPSIHETSTTKETRIRTVFDREIKPYLEEMAKDIEEIKIDIKERKRY